MGPAEPPLLAADCWGAATWQCRAEVMRQCSTFALLGFVCSQLLRQPPKLMINPQEL